MAIQIPIISEIANRIWCINEFSLDAMFLLEGDEKALLIDTGTGVCDIKSYISYLTQKPLIVALTHGHIDHAGGMNMFSEVYAHEDDFGLARKLTVEDRKQYTRLVLNPEENVFKITEDSVVESSMKAKLLPLKEGDVIHLGNRDVEVYETPGHTPGGLSYLDKKERIIFSGDACNPNTLLALDDFHGECLPKTNISDLLATARKLEKLHPYYDRNYNGHMGYGSMITFMSMPDNLTRDCITLCEDILSGKVQGTPDNSNPLRIYTGSCLLAKTSTMQILYKPEQIK